MPPTQRLLHLKLALHHQPVDIGDALAQHYGCTPVATVNDPPFAPSYNLKPGCVLPVLYRPVQAALPPALQAASHGEQPHVALRTMRWGLSWGEQEGTGNPVVKNSAVTEGTKPIWATLGKTKRCAVVCQGFFVWRGNGKNKRPFYVWDKTAPVVLLAGLYDTVGPPGGKKYTFTIIYHEDKTHSESLSPIVLRNPATISFWLDTRPQMWNRVLTELITPTTSIYQTLLSHQVVPRIERERSNSPSMIEPISHRRDGISMAFARQIERSTPTQAPTPTPHDEAQLATQPPQPSQPATQPDPAPPRVSLRPLPVAQRAEPKRRGTRGGAKRGSPSRPKRVRSRTPPQTTNPPAKRARVQGAAHDREPSVEIVERPAVQADREASPDIVEIPPPAGRAVRANARTTADAAGSPRAVHAGAGAVSRAASVTPSVVVLSAAPSPSPPPGAKGKGREPPRRGAA